MSTERTGRILIVGGGEDITTGEDKDKGNRVGKVEPLGGGVCLGSQSSTYSVGEKGRVVHPGVATFNGRVLGDEE